MLNELTHFFCELFCFWVCKLDCQLGDLILYYWSCFRIFSGP